MKEELQKLIEQYGADAVAKAAVVAKAAAEALNKHVPTINTPVVTDEQLINTTDRFLPYRKLLITVTVVKKPG